MACLEHECLDCEYVWFDNNPSNRCPKCSSLNTAKTFDEDPE